MLISAALSLTWTTTLRVQIMDAQGKLVSVLVGTPPTVSLSTSGSTHVVLLAAASRPGPHFSPVPGAVSVMVGGVQAVNVSVSADGRRVDFVTPRYSDACNPVAGKSCTGNGAYKALVVQQTGAGFPSSSIVRDFACPPSCPGTVQPLGSSCPRLPPYHVPVLLYVPMAHSVLPCVVWPACCRRVLH